MYRTRISKAIIATIAVGGIVTVGAMAPNVLSALSTHSRHTRQRRQTISKSLNRLIENGYVKIQNGRLTLTDDGERLATLIGEGGTSAPTPRTWDGKWRVLIFDIPERRKGAREKVRGMLFNLGFTRLQDSVWVYPYDCEDLITILKIDLKIGKELLYIIADTIENDRSIRGKYGLA